MKRLRITITCSIILLFGLANIWAQAPITVKVKQGWQNRAGDLKTHEILNQKMEVLDFRNADLQDVIRLIAAKANLNILMNPIEVSGKVTLHLEDVRLGVALYNILRTQGLTFVVREDENIVRIVSATLFGETGVETLTEIIPLQYLDAERFATALQMLWPSVAAEKKSEDQEGKEGEGEEQQFEQVSEVALNVTFHRESNSLLVMAPPPKLEQIRDIVATLDKPQNATERPKTTTIQLNWLDTKELATDLNNLFTDFAATTEQAGQKFADVKKLLKGVNESLVRIVPHEAANSIIVTAPSPLYETIVGVIRELDVPQRQVSIEARLVDVNINAFRDIGTNLEAWKIDSDDNSPSNRDFYNYTRNDEGDLEREDYQAPVDIGRTLLPFGAAAASGFDFALGDTINIFGEDFNIGARLAMLEDRQVVEILSNPKVVTMNKQTADIVSVTELPYLTTTISNGTVEQTVNFRLAGTIIEVTPTITANGYVRMAISILQQINTGTSLGVPVLDRRESNTAVIVSSGDTIMTGGIRNLTSSDQITGVPWFHRIPVLGWLFKYKGNSQEKNELYLFVTPQIIDEVILTNEERGWYDRIDTQWHLPDYFFDDVKNVTDMD